MLLQQGFKMVTWYKCQASPINKKINKFVQSHLGCPTPTSPYQYMAPLLGSRHLMFHHVKYSFLAQVSPTRRPSEPSGITVQPHKQWELLLNNCAKNTFLTVHMHRFPGWAAGADLCHQRLQPRVLLRTQWSTGEQNGTCWMHFKENQHFNESCSPLQAEINIILEIQALGKKKFFSLLVEINFKMLFDSEIAQSKATGRL